MDPRKSDLLSKNINQYDFAIRHDDEKLHSHTVYLREKNGKLTYSMIDANGEEIHDVPIPHIHPATNFNQQNTVAISDETKNIILNLISKNNSHGESKNKTKPLQMVNWKSGISVLIYHEFLRFLIASQPKTQLIVDNLRIFIISNIIPDMKTLDFSNKTLKEKIKNYSDVKEKIKNHEYTGFGYIMTAALFLKDTDLKLSVLGINADDQFIKILDFNKNYFNFSTSSNVAELDIEMLPFLRSFSPVNWASIIINSVKQLDPVLADVNLSDNENFRNEVNEILFKIALLPTGFFSDFVKFYTQEIINNYPEFENEIRKERNALIETLTEYHENFIEVALNNSSFVKYLTTHQCQAVLQQYISDIECFTTANNNLLYKNSENITNEILQLASEYIKAAKKTMDNVSQSKIGTFQEMPEKSKTAALNATKLSISAIFPKKSLRLLPESLDENLYLSLIKNLNSYLNSRRKNTGEIKFSFSTFFRDKEATLKNIDLAENLLKFIYENRQSHGIHAKIIEEINNVKRNESVSKDSDFRVLLDKIKNLVTETPITRKFMLIETNKRFGK